MRLVMLAACAVALAGCGGSDAPPAPAQHAPAVVRVAMHGNKFEPRRIVVRAGQTVVWTNRDAVAHTVASSRLKLASEAIDPGKTFSFRAPRAGRFPYYCTIHANQTGVLIVRG
jgi:plastocyanin